MFGRADGTVATTHMRFVKQLTHGGIIMPMAVNYC